MLLSRLRGTLFQAITTPVGDSLAPIRVPKDIARRINVALGSPLAKDLRGQLQLLDFHAATLEFGDGAIVQILCFELD